VQPKDDRSEMLLWIWPLRNLILRIAAGKYNETSLPTELYPTGNAELVARYNPPRYRSESTLRLMSVVKMVREVPVEAIEVPSLWLYSERDDAVNVEALKAFRARTGGGAELRVVEGAHAHMLAGDLFSPETTPVVTEAVLEFLAERKIAQ
jgi:alpha-beta hydrolase superfamily lysophospholipase